MTLRLTLRHLEAFRAIILRGTVTSAAEVMHITQPAVSKLLMELERSVGFLLFERRKGRLTLNDSGRRFFKDVERTFLAIDQLHLSAASIREHKEGHLSIGCQPALSTGLLASAISSFLADGRNVTFSIYPLIAASLREWIATGLVDVGIGGIPIDNPGVLTEQIGTIEAVCILPPTHPCVEKQVIGPQDLRGDRFISLNSQYLSTQYERNPYNIDAIFETAGVERDTRISTAHAAVACATVAQGLGVAIVASVVAHEHRGSDIVVRPFRPRIEFPVFSHHASRAAVSDLAREFVAAVGEKLQPFSSFGDSIAFGL